jgi:two-component system response regulator ChvI
MISEKQRARILIVDDDPLFRESIAGNLVDAGFDIEEAGDGRQSLERLHSERLPDLILLDWKMPGMNGIEVLHRLREARIRIPVLLLTILQDQIYEEAALQVGAADFVEKHRSFAILLKRIELILAGAKVPVLVGVDQLQGQSTRCGHLELRFDINRALWKAQRVDLSLTEFQVVNQLVSSLGLDVSYRDIYDRVKGEGFVAGQGPEGYRCNVRSVIKRIRQKFRLVDGDFKQIETYTGFGYRWVES